MPTPPALTLSGLPFPLVSVGPVAARRPLADADGVTLFAAAGADLFCDPAGGVDPPDAERFVAPVTGDFTLSARVAVEFGEVFDSGVLLCWADDATWFKVCAELDPTRTARVVSVVTRAGASDDANAWPMPTGGAVHLRIARVGAAFAIHASPDGQHWSMVRYFSLGIPAEGEVSIGLLAQSPAGPGTSARFTQVSFGRRRLTDVRDGS